MAGFKLSVKSGCAKRTKRKKNPRNQGSNLLTKQTVKKERVDITESSTHGAFFLEKVFCSLWLRTTFADVSKIKLSECSVCIIENVSSHSVFARWIIGKKNFFDTASFWLIGGTSAKKKKRSKIWKYGYRLFGVQTEVFWGRQVWLKFLVFLPDLPIQVFIPLIDMDLWNQSISFIVRKDQWDRLFTVPNKHAAHITKGVIFPINKDCFCFFFLFFQ